MTAVARPLVAPDWATLANYGAGPYPGFANKQQPSAGKIAEGFDPADYLPAEWLNWALNNHGQWINYLDASTGRLLFGDGSDGAASMDGVTAVAGCALSFGNYTAQRDLFFTDLTITVGANVLQMAGFRLYVSGTLTINAPIRANGNGQNPGGNNGIVGATSTGGNGGAIGGVGANGGAATAALGGAGGAGGAGNGGFAAGAGGALTAPTATQGGIHTTQSMILGLLFGVAGAVAVNGGTGGGGGGGAGSTNAGSNGGGPGGVLIVVARTLRVNAGGTLEAKGAVGGNGSGAGAAAAGSGGGGGGGAVLLTYLQLDPASIDPATVINVVGGAGGVGGNANGTAGAAGHSYILAGVTGVSAIASTTHIEEGNITVAGNATVTANFVAPFAAAPPNPAGYKFRWDIAVTDGGPAPTIRLTALTLNSMTWTIDSDNFNGVLSWRATA